jgi:hypothetical protein
MKCTSLILAILSAGFGLIAAYKWYRASRVNFVPFEKVDGRLVPVPMDDVHVWISNLRHTLETSGGLNKHAALWTAASVALAGLSALAVALATSN